MLVYRNNRLAEPGHVPARRQMLASVSAGLISGICASGAAAAGSSQDEANREEIALKPGENYVRNDLILHNRLSFPEGARINIASGAVLKLLGDIDAPPVQIFSGAGRVDLTQSKILAARPEWWGAVADDPKVDCLAAFTACLEAHLVMVLGPGSYHIRDTWAITQPNRRIAGIGRTKDAAGTRILLTKGGKGTVARLGTKKAPASINEYLAGVDIRGLEFGRNAMPDGAQGDAAVGLAVRHVLDCRLEDLRANEHEICFSLRGAVRTYLRDCRAFRSLASATGTDRFIGFDLDGRDPPISTGANASLYLIDCNAAVGGSPRLATSIGARMLGAMSDTFLTRFETTTLAEGIHIDGGIGRLGRSAGRFAQIDVHVDTPVLDQCSGSGISLANLGDGAMLEIRSPYVALAAGASAAISVQDCRGSIRVSGGQLVGSFSTQALGISIERASGPVVDGTALLGFVRPVTVRDTRCFELQFLAIGETVAAAPVVSIERSREGYLRPRVSGTATAYASAVAIDGASGRLSIETIGIDPDCLAQGGAIVSRKGRAIVVPPAASTIFIPSA